MIQDNNITSIDSPEKLYGYIDTLQSCVAQLSDENGELKKALLAARRSIAAYKAASTKRRSSKVVVAANSMNL